MASCPRAKLETIGDVGCGIGVILSETRRPLHQRLQLQRGLALDRWVAVLRQSLRNRMRASSLCGHAGYCRNVEAALRSVWREWYRTQEVG